MRQGWNLENTYLTLPGRFYSLVESNPISEPRSIVFNVPLAKELGLDVESLQTKSGIEILSGNGFPQGSVPISQAYSGHQFGHFTTLGDGRALLIGEQRTPKNLLFDIQLKGSGPTPYSRRGDGRATIGPMLREYIISEAMNSLGIPTTRSLSVVGSKDIVYREKPLKAAVLCRVAKSHIRVGTFEFASKLGSLDDLRALTDYTINRHERECIENDNPYLEFLKRVIQKQAILTAKWMLVGFIHGVMNTDNMSIAGETIDYGPCAFMDTYSPGTVFSSIDENGRYAYGNQPSVTRWNLAVFAETLLPLLDEDKMKGIQLAKEALGEFEDLYYQEWFSGMKAKLGLLNEDSEDKSIIVDLLRLMEENKTDFTYFFSSLTLGNLEGLALFKTGKDKAWKEKWEKRLDRQIGGKSAGREIMGKTNPWIIPRNIDVERVLTAAVDHENYIPVNELIEKLSNPFDYSKIGEEQRLPPEKLERQYKTYCGT